MIAEALSPSKGTHACAGDSHVGLVRTRNEDALLLRPEIGLWAVADGIGGLANGAAASAAVIAALSALEPGANLGGRALHTLSALNDRLAAGEWAQGRRVRETQDEPTMGSTVVALVCENDRFECLWAGDSRLYRYRDGAIEQVTSDHTAIQEMIDAGLVDEASRASSGLDHVLSRAIGIKTPLELVRVTGQIQPGDVFLLCTDGLSKAVPETLIADGMAEPDPKDAVRQLIAAALRHGGPDNITAIVVRTAPASRVVPRRPGLPEPDPSAPPAMEDAGESRLLTASVAAFEPATVTPVRGRWGSRIGVLAILCTLLLAAIGTLEWLDALEMALAPSPDGPAAASAILLAGSEKFRLVLGAGLLLQGAGWLGFAGRRLKALLPLAILFLALGILVGGLALTDEGTVFILQRLLPQGGTLVSYVRNLLTNEVLSWLPSL